MWGRWVTPCIAALCLTWVIPTCARVVDFEAVGGKAEDESEATEWSNGRLLNETLNSLQSGDTLLIPKKSFHLMGGILAGALQNVVIQIDGSLIFSSRKQAWPRHPGGGVLSCLRFENVVNLTLTSSGKGTLDGQGKAWWGYLDYLKIQENRPRLLEMSQLQGVLVERLLLTNAPYWTTWFSGVDGLEIRYSDILNRRSAYKGHGLFDLGAFNTDGWDVSGKNIWIHHSKVWNQDDCFAVKGSSSNVLIENVEASGLGLTIGSEGGNDRVRNVTFRNVYMEKTFKGIYMKFREIGEGEVGLIEDVTYENIYMKEPEQWGIWIGPAQQSDSRRFWQGHPCSLLWPNIPGATCKAAERGIYRNILLKNVTIDNPKLQPGVIFSSADYPIQNISFDSVRVVNWRGRKDKLQYKLCEGVNASLARVLGATYLRRMGIRYFDVVLLITSSRFTEAELMLAEELQKFEVPYFMVRNKVDIDIASEILREEEALEGDDGDECELPKEDRERVEQQTISCIKTYFASEYSVDRVYCVSSRRKLRSNHDFPSLEADILEAIRMQRS
ncbi:unnamed protein product [Symbiodinium sp. CCMP2456]|nr:unnamed protein product [Symbiodinium sp. CCMP2456]